MCWQTSNVCGPTNGSGCWDTQRIRKTKKGLPGPSEIKMLTVDEAAEILGVGPHWLCNHSAELLFARNRRQTVCFAERGLYRGWSGRAGTLGGVSPIQPSDR